MFPSSVFKSWIYSTPAIGANAFISALPLTSNILHDIITWINSLSDCRKRYDDKKYTMPLSSAINNYYARQFIFLFMVDVVQKIRYLKKNFIYDLKTWNCIIVSNRVLSCLMKENNYFLWKNSVHFAGILSLRASSQVEIYNRLGTAPVQQKDLKYWRGSGIVLA